MKQSGSLVSFALYGLAAQIVFLGIAKFFFDMPTPALSLAVDTLFVVWAFVAIRQIMDWKTFDNPIEDYLRETYLSTDTVDRAAFAFIGGLIIFFGNPLFWSLGPKGLLLGMVSVSFFQNVHEIVRITLVNQNIATQKAGG
jgi:hypothetical protein